MHPKVETLKRNLTPEEWNDMLITVMSGDMEFFTEGLTDIDLEEDNGPGRGILEKLAYMGYDSDQDNFPYNELQEYADALTEKLKTVALDDLYERIELTDADIEKQFPNHWIEQSHARFVDLDSEDYSPTRVVRRRYKPIRPIK